MRGDRLRLLREKRGMTHQEIADAIGIGYASVYRYESEKIDPSSETVLKLAKLFDVSTDYLMGNNDDASPQLRVDNLSPVEKRVLSALRSGNRVEAIRLIVSDEESELKAAAN